MSPSLDKTLPMLLGEVMLPMLEQRKRMIENLKRSIVLDL